MQEKNYKSILSKAPFGYAYHRIVVDNQGIPVDYEFLEINKAFQRITGLKEANIIGKTLCELFPGIREGHFDWVAHYGKVALEGTTFEFEQYSEPLKRWYRIQASSAEKGYFTTIFTDISTQYKLADLAQTFLSYTPETIDYQFIIDTACQIAGAAYATINVFDEDGKAYTTLAFSGMTPKVKKIADTLGFRLVNKKWEFDPERQRKISQQKTTIFESLSQLSGKVLSSSLVDTIANAFNLGKLAITKTEKQGRILGDFTLLFTKNNHLQNQALLETYADITGLLLDRIQHEKDIVRERARLEQITAQLTDVVWRTDMQLTTTFISPSVERILGFTVEEYLHLTVEQRYTPEQLQLFMSILSEELENEKKHTTDLHRTRTIEIEHFKADRTTIQLEIHISFVRDEKGNPIGLQGISRDISARKALEENLQHQTQLRELLMHISSRFINVPLDQVDATVQRSLESLGKFVNADRSYTFYYDWDKLVCNNIYEWCANGIEPQLKNLQAVPINMMIDWVIAHKKGESIMISDVGALPMGQARELLEPQNVKSVLAVPMMNESQCIGFVGFDSVLHHREYSETELQLLEIFAQMLVNVVLRKETVRQLVSAKERAEESDRLKTAFLANISHEIRTPMNGIIGFLNLLRKPSLNDDDRAGYINIVNQSSERLLNTINDIIELSRIESGDMSLEKEKLDLSLFVANYHLLYSRQAKEKGLDFTTFKIHTDKTELYTDQYKLDSILTNLIKNAIKFTDQGSIEVGCFQRGNAPFQFYVRDTGRGIKAEKIEVIFDRFIQEDSTFTRNHEGSGLGLSISKAYVEALGGKIWAESEPGKGSCFYFTLPAE